MANPSWWHGILLFPVVVLMSVISRFASRAFFATAHSPDSSIGVDVALFTLQVLSFWTGILVAVVVLICLLADLRTRSEGRTRSASIVWGLPGIVHLGGMVFAELLVVSVPALTYYLYRRRPDR